MADFFANEIPTVLDCVVDEFSGPDGGGPECGLRGIDQRDCA